MAVACSECLTHAHDQSVGWSVGQSLTSCIGKNGTHNHLPHAKAFDNYDIPPSYYFAAIGLHQHNYNYYEAVVQAYSCSDQDRHVQETGTGTRGRWGIKGAQGPPL